MGGQITNLGRIQMEPDRGFAGAAQAGLEYFSNKRAMEQNAINALYSAVQKAATDEELSLIHSAPNFPKVARLAQSYGLPMIPDATVPGGLTFARGAEYYARRDREKALRTQDLPGGPGQAELVMARSQQAEQDLLPQGYQDASKPKTQWSGPMMNPETGQSTAPTPMFRGEFAPAQGFSELDTPAYEKFLKDWGGDKTFLKMGINPQEAFMRLTKDKTFTPEALKAAITDPNSPERLALLDSKNPDLYEYKGGKFIDKRTGQPVRTREEEYRRIPGMNLFIDEYRATGKTDKLMEAMVGALKVTGQFPGMTTQEAVQAMNQMALSHGGNFETAIMGGYGPRATALGLYGMKAKAREENMGKLLLDFTSKMTEAVDKSASRFEKLIPQIVTGAAKPEDFTAILTELQAMGGTWEETGKGLLGEEMARKLNIRNAFGAHAPKVNAQLTKAIVENMDPRKTMLYVDMATTVTNMLAPDQALQNHAAYSSLLQQRGEKVLQMDAEAIITLHQAGKLKSFLKNPNKYYHMAMADARSGGVGLFMIPSAEHLMTGPDLDQLNNFFDTKYYGSVQEKQVQAKGMFERLIGSIGVGGGGPTESARQEMEVLKTPMRPIAERNESLTQGRM